MLLIDEARITPGTQSRRHGERRRPPASRLARLPIALAAAVLALAVLSGPAAARSADAYLMCGWQVEPRPQSVSVDPDLAAAGLSQADVRAAFEGWNRLFERHHGFPIFVVHYGDWWEADVLLTAHGWDRTWVQGACDPAYVRRGSNQSIVFVGARDAWRNRELLAHELGHALGLADHATAAQVTAGHVGVKPCDDYVGVMSYCAGPQTWFLDRDAAGTGLVLDGQLVRDFWRP